MFPTVKDRPTDPPGKPPGKPPETGVLEMAKPEDGTTPERTVPMEIIIKVGQDLVSERKFLLYPGTETVYGQAVDAAVAIVLGQVSKAAYELVSGAGDAVPEGMALEAAFGAAVQAKTA